MSRTEELFLDALRCALHNEQVQWAKPLASEEWLRLFRLADENNVYPLIVEATQASEALSALPKRRERAIAKARRLTVNQASRTGEFILLLRFLKEKGLYPIITKGMICRSLYPNPEERPSVDEDMLIDPAEMPRYHEALTEFGLPLFEPDCDIENDFEVAYRDDKRGVYVEVHKRFFSPDSSAYGDLNDFFAGVRERSTEIVFAGTSVRTLSPTDHILYLILHAYKHFLHSGVGIRQLADINMFAAKYSGEIDWQYVRSSCEKVRVDKLASAMFLIGEKYLGFTVPEVFYGIETDAEPFLNDVLSGGLYGANDINRLHASTMTLEAVASQKEGRRRKGALHSVFLPARDLEGRYTFLKNKRWLLPAAWIARVWNYVFKREHGPVSAKESIRIAKDRIELLKEYGIIE